MAAKAAQCFVALSWQRVSSPAVYADQMTSLGQEIIAAQPTMASLFNLVNRILSETEEARRSGSVDNLQRALRDAVQRYVESTHSALEKIAGYGAGLLPSPCTVMTHSSSKTVVGILREASRTGKSLQAIVTESRPFCEGRELARNLGQQGITTKVVLDAAIAHYVREADIIIVGADRIAEQSFLNKVGTLSLAMAAHEEQVPFYVAAETSKLLSAGLAPIGPVLEATEQRQREEWMNVELVYSLFEEIPNRWISGVVTEEGIISMNHLAKYFRQFQVSPSLTRRDAAVTHA